MHLTVSKIPPSHMNCSIALGSNHVLRAPTPLTKDVSRVYPPIPLSSPVLLPCVPLPCVPAVAGVYPFRSLPLVLAALFWFLPTLPSSLLLPPFCVSPPGLTLLCLFVPDWRRAPSVCPDPCPVCSPCPLLLPCTLLDLCCPYSTIPYHCLLLEPASSLFPVSVARPAVEHLTRWSHGPLKELYCGKGPLEGKEQTAQVAPHLKWNTAKVNLLNTERHQ